MWELSNLKLCINTLKNLEVRTPIRRKNITALINPCVEDLHLDPNTKCLGAEDETLFYTKLLTDKLLYRWISALTLHNMLILEPWFRTIALIGKLDCFTNFIRKLWFICTQFTNMSDWNAKTITCRNPYQIKASRYLTRWLVIIFNPNKLISII